MRAVFVPALVGAALAAPCQAQKVCFSDNTGQPHGFNATLRSWFALKVANGGRTSVVTGVGFRIQAFGRTTSTRMAVWSEDQRTRAPGKMLAQGAVQIDDKAPAFYVARLDKPVVVQPKTNFFISVFLGNGIRPALTKSGNINSHWWGGPPNWRGPFRSFGWLWRVYCGSNKGTFVRFGKGKPGTGNVAPRMWGLGFPNIGNPVTLQINRARPGAAAVLVVGPRTNVIFPFGTALAFPPLISVTGRTQPASPGYLNVPFTLPDFPPLGGFKVAAQGWIVDPNAQASLSHTDAVEMTIGK